MYFPMPRSLQSQFVPGNDFSVLFYVLLDSLKSHKCIRLALFHVCEKVFHLATATRESRLANGELSRSCLIHLIPSLVAIIRVLFILYPSYTHGKAVEGMALIKASMVGKRMRAVLVDEPEAEQVDFDYTISRKALYFVVNVEGSFGRLVTLMFLLSSQAKCLFNWIGSRGRYRFLG